MKRSLLIIATVGCCWTDVASLSDGVGPATAACSDAKKHVFRAPAWSPYDNPGDAHRGWPATSCPVCRTNKNILPLAPAAVSDRLSFNLTESVLNAINITTSLHPEGEYTLLARFEGKLAKDPNDDILPLNQSVCLSKGVPMRFSGPYWDSSVARARERWQAFLGRYHELGGVVDELVMDTEQGVSTWEISCNGWPWQTPACAELLWDSIASNPGFDKIYKELSRFGVTKNASDPHWLSTAMKNCMGIVFFFRHRRTLTTTRLCISQARTNRLCLVTLMAVQRKNQCYTALYSINLCFTLPVAGCK
eukprot:m.467365 g.467365  ORF g.467365 m.467365 type:complete len:306 (+) comp21638_c0_seq3:189-1106(+)